ncbi:MAG: murein transglycosylase A [Rhodothalassiaceae bacterium]
MSLGPARHYLPDLLPLALLIALAILFHLLPRPESEDPGPKLRPARFEDLPGWHEDDPRPGLSALARSCRLRLALADAHPVEPVAIGGRVGDWRPVCEALATRDFADAEAARAFLQAHFSPFALSAGGSGTGLFTGYYEPEIAAAFAPDEDYRIPIHRRPDDLVSVDLGLFRPDLAGRAIHGRVEAGRLLPHASRDEIAKGALEGRGLALLWARDPVDLFFLHIQGSGRVRLPDGRMLRIGYDGANGHPYRALGRLMADRGLIARDGISAQAIADWLRAHPQEAPALMAENPAYVFFRILPDDGPVGSEGTVLTPGRSLAIDRAHLPLGVPLWLDSSLPARDNGARGSGAPRLARLMVAQDSGSAIRGAIRGDVFWGAGPEASDIAGHMAERGRLWLLLPRPLALRLAGET